MRELPVIDQQETITRYQKRFQQFGYSPQSLGWTKEKQDIRFEVLLSFFQCENRSFIDVGCGFGDLNEILRQYCEHYRYCGIDILEDFVTEGRVQYGGAEVEFRCGEFLSLDIAEKYDYGIANGIFNVSFVQIEAVPFF